jgi:hypothetical protein
VQIPFATGHDSFQLALARCRAKGVLGAAWFSVGAAYISPYDTRADEPDLVEALVSAAAAAQIAGAPLIVIAGDLNARHPSWDPGLVHLDHGNWTRGEAVARGLAALALHASAGPSYDRLDHKTKDVTGSTYIDLVATAVPCVAAPTLVSFGNLDHRAVLVNVGDERPAKLRAHWVRVWVWRGVDWDDLPTQRRFLTTLSECIGVGGAGTLRTGDRSIIIDRGLHLACSSIAAERWVNAAKLCVPKTGVEMLESAAKSAASKGPFWFARALRQGETGPPPPVLRRQSDPTVGLVGPSQAAAVAERFAATHSRAGLSLPALPPLPKLSQFRLEPGIVRLALTTQRQSAGRDEHGISPKLLLIAAQCDRFVNALTRLLEDIVTSGEAPKLWKRLLVVPLGKKDKNRIFLESYRAIFITHWLSRVGETVFEWFDRASISRVPQSLLGVEVPHGLDPMQVGFRAGLGDHVVTLAGIDLLQTAAQRHLMLVQLLVDLTDAFPSTHHPTALRELQAAGATEAGLIFRAALAEDNVMVARIGLFKSAEKPAEDGIKAGRWTSGMGCVLQTPTSWAAEWPGFGLAAPRLHWRGCAGWICGMQR